MIKPINSVNKNPFSDFTVSGRIPEYYVSGEYTADSFVSDEKEKKHSALVWKIAVSAMTVGFGTLALMKGLPKNTTQKLVKFKDYLTKKFHSVSEEIKTENINQKYEESVEKVNKMIEKSQSLNNLGWIKDVMFLKLMGVNKYTARLHAAITKKFDRLSLKTVNRAYGASDESFEKLFGLMDDAAKSAVTDKSKPQASEILARIAEKRKTMTETLHNSFNITERTERHGKMRDSMVNLVDDFLKEFRTKKSYKSSIAEELLAETKTELHAPLLAARAKIAGEGKTLSGGTLKEILDLYKEILPADKFTKLQTAAAKSVKKLDKAIDTDAVEYFDKYRDLVLGCAPTDTLSVLTSLGAVGWGLSTAEDKNEKASVLLKVGLPIVGSVATTLYFTARLVSGFKAFAYGGLSGFVFSQGGAIIDNFRQKHLNKLNLLAQKSPENKEQSTKKGAYVDNSTKNG